MKTTLEKLADLIQEATKILEEEGINKSENPRIEKEFKNEDFHIKVWETEEEIGGKTIFVREGFERKQSVCIGKEFHTFYFYASLPRFGMERLTDKIKKSEMQGYTFQDIIEDLETAHNESLNAHNKEVTIKDVIKELGNVDTITEKWNILGNYEFNCRHPSGNFGAWHSLQNDESILNSTYAYELGLLKLRRKEG